MPGNKVVLTFAGDADALTKAAKKAEQATTGVADSVNKSNKAMTNAAGAGAKLNTGLGHLGSTISGASTALDDFSGGFQAYVNIQQSSINKAARQARAIADVNQAQLDLNQAFRDSKQSTLDSAQAAVDVTQANLDAVTAQKDYNEAVKKYGKNSDEARQAAIDMSQAQLDVQQANEDAAQAAQDGSQATQDAKDAQLDLNDAQRAAKPPTDLQKWSDDIALVTPLLSAVIGIIGLVTAAQWLWNLSLLASPVTWVVLAIVALIAIIVLIATKTTWFQTIWRLAWTWVKNAAVDVWSWLKDLPHKMGAVFSLLAGAITAPFRLAFNLVARAWNATIGSLSWSVPGWIPGIGGRTISAPHLPTFHTGGVVPGAPGSQMLAVLQAGERVTPAGGGGFVLEIRSGGSRLDDLLVQVLARAVSERGGNVQLVLGGGRA